MSLKQLSSRTLAQCLLPKTLLKKEFFQDTNVPMIQQPKDSDTLSLSFSEITQMIEAAREVGRREGAGTLDEAYLRSLGLVPIRNLTVR